MPPICLLVSVVVLCYSAMQGNGQCTISSLKDSVSGSNESLMEKFIVLEEKFQLMYEGHEREIQIINEKLDAVLNQAYCRGNPALCDCSTIRANGFTTSKVYPIYVDHQNERHYANAFCDMTTGNAGWTVFQRRKDGSEDFYRGWNDYENGFGNPKREFWLGNNFLYMLTSKRRYRLRIDLEDFEGRKRYAEYSTFNISSAWNNYRLRIGTYYGNAGDSLSNHNGHQFTTNDQDNDVYSEVNCAVQRHGAWWYHSCHDSNLNGRYYRSGSYSCIDCGESGDGVVWWYWRNSPYSYKSTEMKISAY